jgi:hypothetical protein
MADRLIHPLSPAEESRLDALADAIEAERPRIIARLAREELASREDSIAGQLRRAIDASLLGPELLAREAGIDLPTFLAFQSSETDLPFEVFARIAQRVGFTLVLQSA